MIKRTGKIYDVDMMVDDHGTLSADIRIKLEGGGYVTATLVRTSLGNYPKMKTNFVDKLSDFLIKNVKTGPAWCLSDLKGRKVLCSFDINWLKDWKLVK